MFETILDNGGVEEKAAKVLIGRFAVAAKRSPVGSGRACLPGIRSCMHMKMQQRGARSGSADVRAASAAAVPAGWRGGMPSNLPLTHSAPELRFENVYISACALLACCWAQAWTVLAHCACTVRRALNAARAHLPRPAVLRRLQRLCRGTRPRTQRASGHAPGQPSAWLSCWRLLKALAFIQLVVQ